MHKLTKQERKNKRRGVFGKTRKSKMPHPHTFAEERWVLTSSVPGQEGPMVFLSEKRANRVASAIALTFNTSVELDHQFKNNNGEWVS